jgi:hypothetical protein
VLALGLSACASWNVDVSRLQLGMEPEAVREAIGKPFSPSARPRCTRAKSFPKSGNICRRPSRGRPKTYWVYFENGKVVQWGEPGDFSGSPAAAVANTTRTRAPGSSDVYWMAGLSVNSQPVAVRPATTLGLSASIAYQDYFVRNDLDTATYNLTANFQTAHPRLALGGMASAIYSVDSSEHEYVPGGAVRDPVLTHLGNVFANWNYRILRLEANTGFTRERHDYEEFWAGDKDETTTVASAFLDVFSWGSLFYTWERTVTTLLLSEQKTDEVTETLGITGAIPVEVLRRPKITYSLGVSREQTTTDDDTDDTDWEFVHTVTVQDEFEISKTVRLSASASWVNDVGPEEEEVSFQYSLNLVQQLGPRAQHSLLFTQEPRPTFGSTSDTETTSYGYRLTIQDLVFYNLSFALGLTYQEDTPLEVEDAVTETTTTLTLGLNAAFWPGTA